MAQATDTRTTSRDRVVAFPRQFTTQPFSLTYKFEELPIFQHRIGAETFHAGLIDGEATIEYDHDGDWTIVDVSIRGGNLRLGTAARDRMINLHADNDRYLYWMILDALEGTRSSHFEDIIAEELAEHRTA